MRTAEVYQQEMLAGTLEEDAAGKYSFRYREGYAGEPVSLTLPVADQVYEFGRFPAVFEGLLPEGASLEALLRRYKLDRGDLFGQLLLVGEDVVGSLRVREVR